MNSYYTQLGKGTLVAMSASWLLISTTVFAQENKKEPAQSGLGMDEIVVTGQAGADQLRKSEVSFSISTFSAEELAERAPKSVAEIFQVIPGVWADPPGGDASNGLRVRGMPYDGYEAVAVLEDGLPIQHDAGIAWLNVDQFIRHDITYERIEAVRGGPSSLFSSSAPGGVINFITRKGGDEPEGRLKVTTSDYGTRRVDAYYGGPIGGDWRILVGGFYRVDDGQREPSFTANDGGQYRVILSAAV